MRKRTVENPVKYSRVRLRLTSSIHAGLKTPGPEKKFFAYYDTAQWMGKLVSEAHPTEPVVVYTGAGKSGVILAGERRTVDREGIKAGPWAGGSGRKTRCSYL